jgi:pimeloyl-ACP methyl ester carboxylesterase
VPLLFIHGGYGGPSSTLWRGPNLIADALGDLARVVTYDRRSSGRSQYVLDEYTLEDVSNDARALLDRLQIERSIVIGSSAGGTIALDYALRWPERVIALALPNTGPAIMSAEPLGLDEPHSGEVRDRLATVAARIALVELARAQGDRAAFESRREEFREPPPPNAVVNDGAQAQQRAEALRRALAEASEENLFRWSTGNIRNMAAAAGHDVTSRLGELRMPVCVIHGNADTVVPFEYGRIFDRGISHAEFHEIDGAGHGIVANAEAQAILREWVTRVASDVMHG